jgi:hypothetical protein
MESFWKMARLLTRHFNSCLHILLGVGDEIPSFEIKKFQLFFGGGLGLEVELLRAAKQVIGYFVLNIMT